MHLLHSTRLAAFIALLFTLSACAPTYSINAREPHRFAPKNGTAGVIFAAPTGPYQIVADFHGSEPGKCPEDLPYCEVRREASRMGADAVWIQQRSVFSYQDEWIMIQGRLTKIEHPTITTITGVFVRYGD